jgi:hypothetical protein
MINFLPVDFSNSFILTSARRTRLFNWSICTCSFLSFCCSSNSLVKPPWFKNISVKSVASKNTSKFLISSLLMCDVTMSLYKSVFRTAYRICCFWSGYTCSQILYEEIGTPFSLLSTRNFRILSFASCSVIMSIYCHVLSVFYVRLQRLALLLALVSRGIARQANVPMRVWYVPCAGLPCMCVGTCPSAGARQLRGLSGGITHNG